MNGLKDEGIGIGTGNGSESGRAGSLQEYRKWANESIKSPLTADTNKTGKTSESLRSASLS